MSSTKVASRQLCWNRANSTSKIRDFEWSLKPFILFLRSIGVPLEFQSSQQSLKDRRRSWWIVTAFGFLAFFLNAECILYWVGENVSQIANDLQVSKERTRTFAVFSNAILIVNTAVIYLGSHGLLIKLALMEDWCQMIRILKLMEREMVYSDEDYRRFRTVSLVAVAASFAVGCNILY